MLMAQLAVLEWGAVSPALRGSQCAHRRLSYMCARLPVVPPVERANTLLSTGRWAKHRQHCWVHGSASITLNLVNLCVCPSLVVTMACAPGTPIQLLSTLESLPRFMAQNELSITHQDVSNAASQGLISQHRADRVATILDIANLKGEPMVVAQTSLSARLANSQETRSLFFFSVYAPGVDPNRVNFHALSTGRAIVTLDLSDRANPQIRSRSTEYRQNRVATETVVVALALFASAFYHLLEGFKLPTEIPEDPQEPQDKTEVEYESDDDCIAKLDPKLEWKVKYVHKHHRYPQKKTALGGSSTIPQYYKQRSTSCVSCGWLVVHMRAVG